MQVAAAHPLEQARLDALRELRVLDSAREVVFDNLAELVSLICQTPIAVISLIDESRQWFKAVKGIGVDETPRDVAFCSHAILQSDTFVVPDASEDPRFCDNPLVVGEPRIRFYAGHPLVTSSGLPLGTLCAIDNKPHTLTAGQQRALTILAHQVVAHLEARASLLDLEQTVAADALQSRSVERWLRAIAHDMRAPFTSVIGLSELLVEDLDVLARRDVLGYLRDINDAARMALQMLEGLLEVARARGDSESMRSHSIYVEGVLHSIRTMVSGLAATKRISVDITCEPNLVACAEPRMLQSIVQNLVSNAIKFTPPDGTVSLRACVEQGATVIRVRDTGVGMSEERVARLFEGDSIGSTRGTAGESGIGWGLRLCREFCQVSRATLAIRSTVGQGTECTVRFG